MNFKNLSYVFATLSFSLILGAAVYEHATLWPNAYSAVPKSLAVFQGPYKLNAAAFWMYIHPVTLLLFSVALLTSWQTERKKFVLIPMLGYIGVLLTTFAFFVPELMELTSTPYSDTVDASLTSRGQRWIVLSLLRAAFLFVLAVMLYLGLTKSELKTTLAG